MYVGTILAYLPVRHCLDKLLTLKSVYKIVCKGREYMALTFNQLTASKKTIDRLCQWCIVWIVDQSKPNGENHEYY